MLDQLFTSEKKTSDYLEKIIIPTISISENKKPIPTPTNLREILMFEKEKELIKKNFSWSLTKQTQFKTVIFCRITTELNKCVSIYGAISYFGKKKNYFIEIISPKIRFEFSIEKFYYKENLMLQITKISGKAADIIDDKIHEFAIIYDK